LMCELEDGRRFLHKANRRRLARLMLLLP